VLGAADALTSSLPLTSLPFFFVWYAVFREPFGFSGAGLNIESYSNYIGLYPVKTGM